MDFWIFLLHVRKINFDGLSEIKGGYFYVTMDIWGISLFIIIGNETLLKSFFFNMNKLNDTWNIIIYIRNLETWILYRGKADGVSKVVRDAYQSYKDLEFKAKEVERSDPNLHVKLICLAGKEVFKKKQVIVPLPFPSLFDEF